MAENRGIKIDNLEKNLYVFLAAGFISGLITRYVNNDDELYWDYVLKELVDLRNDQAMGQGQETLESIKAQLIPNGPPTNWEVFANKVFISTAIFGGYFATMNYPFLKNSNFLRLGYACAVSVVGTFLSHPIAMISNEKVQKVMMGYYSSVEVQRTYDMNRTTMLKQSLQNFVYTSLNTLTTPYVYSAGISMWTTGLTYQILGNALGFSL